MATANRCEFRLTNQSIHFGDYHVPRKYIDHFDVLAGDMQAVRLWSKRTARGEGFKTTIVFHCETEGKTKEVADTLFQHFPISVDPFRAIDTFVVHENGGDFSGFAFSLSQTHEAQVPQLFWLSNYFPPDRFDIRDLTVTKTKEQFCTVLSKFPNTPERIAEINEIFEKMNQRITGNTIAYALGDNGDTRYPGLKRPEKEISCLCCVDGMGTGKERLFEIYSDRMKRVYWPPAKKVVTGPEETDFHWQNSSRKEVASCQKEMDDWFHTPPEEAKE